MAPPSSRVLKYINGLKSLSITPITRQALEDWSKQEMRGGEMDAPNVTRSSLETLEDIFVSRTAADKQIRLGSQGA